MSVPVRDATGRHGPEAEKIQIILDCLEPFLDLPDVEIREDTDGRCLEGSVWESFLGEGNQDPLARYWEDTRTIQIFERSFSYNPSGRRPFPIPNWWTEEWAPEVEIFYQKWGGSFVGNLLHELGHHLWAVVVRPSYGTSLYWLHNAIIGDGLGGVTPAIEWINRQIGKDHPVIVEEDFAESFRFYCVVPRRFSARYPCRAEMIRQLLRGGR